MEKSSLNIKSFRNLLSYQGKSYKIPPDNYQPNEVKLINGAINDNAAGCSIEDIYSLKRHKASAAASDRGCDRRHVCDAVCGTLVKLLRRYNSSFFLPIFTPIFSSICVIIVIAALFGTSWIITEERIANTVRHNTSSHPVIIKSSNASLWIICTRFVFNNTVIEPLFHKNCTRIDYSDIERHHSDQQSAEYVILYTITLSSPLLIISFIILLISYLLFLLAICSQKYKIYYFVAGIGFIITGLLMLSGLITFIAIFESEIFHKMHPSGHEPIVFTFYFGHSFMLYVIGFIVVELAGILNVCFFNKLQKAEELNQNHLLNNYVKPVHAPTASNHHTHIAFTNMDNGYIPQKSIHCSHHPTSKLNANDCYTNNGMPYRPKQQLQPSHQRPLPARFDAFNHVPFTRNASTSTLDLDNELDDGDRMSAKSNHRPMKDKSGNNKLDFNNICGMMRPAKTKDGCSGHSNANVYHRAVKPARNIYYIKDRTDEDEPNIFIVDPRFYKNRKCALQKSLEDIRMQKVNNSYGRPHYHYDTISCSGGWNNSMDRSCYGSKTLPRDFARPKQHNLRPSLGNFLDNFHQNENRINPLSHNHSHSHHNLHSHYHHQPTGYAFHHHSSCDELLSSKLYRNSPLCRDFVESQAQDRQQQPQQQQQEYQWPKVIPKSPSSYSMNSFRINRQSPYDRSSTYNPIEEFDLDKIEHERRKSHTNLFKEGRCPDDLKKEFGTAV